MKRKNRHHESVEVVSKLPASEIAKQIAGIFSESLCPGSPAVIGEIKCSFTLPAHRHWVHSCSLSPDSRYAVSGGWDKSLIVWNMLECTEAWSVLSAHQARIRCCTWNRTSSMVASSSSDGTVALWSIENKQLHFRCRPGMQEVESCSFSADSSMLAACGSSSDIRVLKLPPIERDSLVGSDTKPIVSDLEWDTLVGHSRPGINAVDFAATVNGLLASAGADGTVRLWECHCTTAAAAAPVMEDVHSVQVACLKPHGGSGVRTCAFSPDTAFVVTGGFDRTVAIADVETAQVRTVLRGHTGWVFSVSVSSDCRLIASGAGNPDYGIRVWDVRTGMEVAQLAGNRDHAPCVSFGAGAAQSYALLSGAESHSLRLWSWAEY